MNKEILAFSIVFAWSISVSYAQQVRLNYHEVPLNEILIDLNDRYQIQVSINAGLSRTCEISLKSSFSSIDEALNVLADACGLTLTKFDDVYSIHAPLDEKIHTVSKKKRYLYQGQVLERGTQEPLPFTNLLFQDRGIISDESGRFSFLSEESTKAIQCRHLGYITADTLVANGNNLRFFLQPSSVQLAEIVVTSEDSIPVTEVGHRAGAMTFNDITQNLVPGRSNNLIFNKLRLYPGIMAAGESVADYVIWGSYAGQNQFVFDDITVFNSWGIKDDLGRINANMVKNVEVRKGGYGAAFGDRIGGFVMAESKWGNRKKAEGNLSLNNQLANLYLNIPLLKQSSTLQVAGRTSYYQALDFSQPFQRELDSDYLNPVYDYEDLNIKWSTLFGNRDALEVSVLASADTYVGEFQEGSEDDSEESFEDQEISSVQYGGSFKYSKNWDHGGLSTIVVSTSSYDPSYRASFFFRSEEEEEEEEIEWDGSWNNRVDEFSGKISHQFSEKNGQQVEAGIGLVRNQVRLEQLELFEEEEFFESSSRLTRVTAYVSDRIQLDPKLHVQVGLKGDLPLSNVNVYLQPRINGGFKLNQHWQANFAWGLYRQFLSILSLSDGDGNTLNIWRLANDEEQEGRVLLGRHQMLGFSYKTTDFEANFEGYFNTSNGFSRLNEFLGIEESFRGDTRSFGVDLYAKKQLGRHEIWGAYSLGKVEERFEIDGTLTSFTEAPQSQLHEVKLATVFNFQPVHFSIAHIYGSGFPNNNLRESENTDYGRTDLAFQYNRSFGKIEIEGGFSILNVFNRDNVRLNQSFGIPGNEINIVNTVGIPFTPNVFLGCRF